MKAILRWGAALVALLVLTSVSFGQVRYSPVLKVPYRQAPDCYNSGFYLFDAWGRPTGPHYYLVPPTGPFNGILPGPIGKGIQSGQLPHHVLMSKDGMSIGNAPVLGKQQAPSGGGPNPYGGGPNSYGGGPNSYGGGPNSYGGGPNPYGGGPNPYGGGPNSFNGIPNPYGGGPNPYGGGPNSFNGIPNPYGGGPAMQVPYGAPQMANNPMQPFQPYAGMQPFQQFGGFGPMQGPRMDTMPPPPMLGGASYPTHPFIRSPRDFFMWGESMEEERARGNRPIMVP